MSWDVTLVRTNVEQIEEVNEKTTTPFPIDEVLTQLGKHLDGIETADPSWLSYETNDYEVSFQPAPNEIVLHIHLFSDNSEPAVMEFLTKLCEWLDCRAIDMTNFEWLK